MLLEAAAQRGYDAVLDGDDDIFADDESGGSLNRPAWQRLQRPAEQGLEVRPHRFPYGAGE